MAGDKAPATAEAPPPDPAALAEATEEASQTLEATDATWTPEALEELLAPVALFPDPVLLQVLTASTNPQEVLDAGNWLVANPDLEGNALDEAAEKVGFTAPIRGLIQSPEVIDKLCLNMGWTEELGQAFVNDQQGVMDAVQRLRAQAQEVGTLASSPQMKVETQSEGGKEAIAITPPSPDVVYVPQYDPVAAYAPPAAAPAAAPAATTTTTEEKGHSTGSLITTGLLAFGAGILVSEVFDDDDDHYHGHNDMWYQPVPYYPPYPYRPAYGGGHYPSHGYNRPNNYVRGNNTVIVNQNNNYYKRYDNDRAVASNRKSANSPISRAKPNRSDLSNLNAQAARGPARKAPAASDAWKGKSGYAGADPKNRAAVSNRAASSKSPANGLPKVQGSYAGAKPTRDPSSASKNRTTANRPAGSQNADRGHAPSSKQSRVPSTSQASAPKARTSSVSSQTQRSAIGASNSGKTERAASASGHQSAPKGVSAKAKKAGGKPQRR